jgi:FAD/FMN-containing dehydrogenase
MTQPTLNRRDAAQRLLHDTPNRPDCIVITEPVEVAQAAGLWNREVVARPAAVLRCETAAGVQAALDLTTGAGVPVSVLGGGHAWAGTAIREGGALIDLRSLRTVEIDGSRALVGGGACGSDLLDAAQRSGQTTAFGTVGSVGAVGLLLGGGYGGLAGACGLGVDNVLGADLVLADGRMVRTDAEHEPDLYWAIRGGGGNFGVVTALEIALHAIPAVTTGLLAFPWPQARAVLSGCRAIAEDSDDRLNITFGALTMPEGRLAFAVPTWAGADPAGDESIDRVRRLGSPVIDQVAPMPFAAAVHLLDDPWAGSGHYHLGTCLLPPLTDAAIQTFIEVAEAMPVGCGLNAFHAHGAATHPDPTATAYPYRDEHLNVEILGAWTGDDGREVRAWVQAAEAALGDYALPGGWANQMARHDPRAADAFGPNTERILQVKRRYDPKGVFQSIPLPPAGLSDHSR